MNSLLFASIETAIAAYRIARNHGVYCTLSGKSLRFEDSNDMELAEAVLPSFNINPIYS